MMSQKNMGRQTPQQAIWTVRSLENANHSCFVSCNIINCLLRHLWVILFGLWKTLWILLMWLVLFRWLYNQFGIQHKKITINHRTPELAFHGHGTDTQEHGNSRQGNRQNVTIKKAKNKNWNDLKTIKISKLFVSEAYFFLCIIVVSRDVT